jgi:predicted GNAT family acetyltransferase
VTGLIGFNVYLARANGQDVATAVNVVAGDAVGIYNVATPPEHRGRGYRRLGFREVETYTLFTRPPEVSGSS